MFAEFKKFVLRGNVMDLAVGVIIGAAFGKIVDSLVKDIIMPIIGIGFSADFTNLYIPLHKTYTNLYSCCLLPVSLRPLIIRLGLFRRSAEWAN